MSLARLSSSEIMALKNVKHLFPPESYLFGSRTNRGGRGGDIDILILGDHENLKQQRNLIETKLFLALEMKWDITLLPSVDQMTPSQFTFYSSLTRIPLGTILQNESFSSRV